MSTLSQMAAEARPRSEADWGTERQIDAENAFFDAFRAVMGKPMEDFFASNLKATGEELIDAALEAAKARFGTADVIVPAHVAAG